MHIYINIPSISRIRPRGAGCVMKKRSDGCVEVPTGGCCGDSLFEVRLGEEGSLVLMNGILSGADSSKSDGAKKVGARSSG